MTTPETHPTAYTTTLAAVLPAHTNLLLQAARVDAGQVAHFDFLQAAHLELIRLARALQHPPTAFSGERRACLQDGALRLLQEVMLLELPLADYLQARAMLGVIAAHETHPAPDSPPAATLRTLRETQEAAAEQALQTLRDAPVAEAAALLSDCRR